MVDVKESQDFSKAMIGPVLYLPTIGPLIALLSMTTNQLWVDESSALHLLGKLISSMSRALMNHLGFLFYLGLVSGLAKTHKAEAAFVAAMTWLVYLAVNNSWLALTHRLASSTTNAQLYGNRRAFILGLQVIDMGVFSGIILDCAVASVHNRVAGIELHSTLSIYGGSKLVLIVILPLVGLSAIATVYLWPVIELGISALTGFMKSLGAIGVFLYGLLSRFLIPTELHHLVWSPFASTSTGGQLLVDDQTVTGAKPIFPAEITRHPAGVLSDSARFLTYEMVRILGAAGTALAFYRTAKPGNKRRLKVALIPLIMTPVPVEITEPFEFSFISTTPLLWLIYSLLDGFFRMLAWLFHVRVCITNSFIDFVVYSLPVGVNVTRRPIFAALDLLGIATMYLVGTFCITRLWMLTPGREATVDAGPSEQTGQASEVADRSTLVIAGPGGREDVCVVENCFARLRVDVRDPALVRQSLLEENGGSSVLIKGNHVQVIYDLGVNKARTVVSASLSVTE